MYETERQELIDSIRMKGIKDERVLEAMLQVERHEFIPEIIKPHAYKDVALPIGYAQTISQPYTVAFMTESLELKPNSKVLEIGTGSGYQAAILLEMGMKVFTIERNEDIYRRTQKFFDKHRLRILMRCSDGTIGWEEYAPFDGILVTAGSPSIPEKLKKQLAVGGKMVIPVGSRQTQSMHIVTKLDDENFNIKEIPNFTFVPLIGKEGWNPK